VLKERNQIWKAIPATINSVNEVIEHGGTLQG